MSGWLPPGCTDKDIDDAAPQTPTSSGNLEDFQDQERAIINLELNSRDAESALWWLTEHGYFNVVERICQEALAALPKEIT